MPGSSELSDALNPNFYTGRRLQHSPVTPQVNTRVPLSQQHINYGGVEHLGSRNTTIGTPIGTVANIVSPNTYTESLTTNVRSDSTKSRPPEPLQLLRNILSSLAAQKDAFEVEKERRRVWERDQEARQVERQTELERRLVAMQEEINDLKARSPAALTRTQHCVGVQSEKQLATTAQQTPSLPGSIVPPNISGGPYGYNAIIAQQDASELSEEPIYSTNSQFVEGSSSSPLLSTSSSDQTSRKRMRSLSPTKEVEVSSMILRTRQQSQPRSIQAAMRLHILQCMDLHHDKHLPPSFNEGRPCADTDPVRFVWDQTTRKSPHNARMKSRIVSGLMANKTSYPLVPDEDFTRVKLDSAFEQAFTTLRQKVSGQAAGRSRDKEDAKAQRSRRTSRKKIKLSNRVETRKSFVEYSSSTFDAAFEIECMSSEESSGGEDDADGVPPDDNRPKGCLRIRYLAWRSQRLHRLYEILDEREEFERSQKPKRGVGRKGRRMGQPKDGNPLPPTGVSRWMVSKRWLREAQAGSPHVANVLQASVVNDDDSAWMTLGPLGPESDSEELQAVLQAPQYLDHTGYYLPNSLVNGIGFNYNVIPPPM